MPIYRYVKTYPKRKIKPPQIISFCLIFVGLSIMTWVVWPIVSFQVHAAVLFSKTISPIPQPKIASGIINQVVLAASDSTPVGDDTTNVNNWYPSRPQKKVFSPVDTYLVSIPKLKIKDATVIVAGDDLDKGLIHYGGTGKPGESGTAVIFGHSTLPQLYDPKNYKAIFSLLPTLRPKSESYPGDEIFITYDGITYKYIIYDMKVLDPSDLSTLDQQYDGSYLTLVTCVPPGTLWQRLNVEAKLVPY